ncbi:MAG TPA: type II secretion system protein [Candidatus Baltobacteraceae bacterium]|nr:type II secretion system protein [Candidatus Baltobacteraceae bacterium]
MKYQRGFTLLEMMVVVAIIAVLAGVLIPNFSRARSQAQTSACVGNEKIIATALELYFTDKQSYPATSTVGGTGSTFMTAMSGYMNQTPIDPAAGSTGFYSYTNTSSGGVYSYNIDCPGVHDPNTLQAITGGATTTSTHIKYDSQQGFTTSSS